MVGLFLHACAVAVAIAQGHCPAAPIRHTDEALALGAHAARELVPAAAVVLTVSAAVVDHDVRQAADAVLVALLQPRVVAQRQL